MQCKGLSDPSYKVTHTSGNLSDTFNITTQSFCFYYISYLNKLLAFARSLYNEVLIKAAPHLFHQFLDKFQIKKKKHLLGQIPSIGINFQDSGNIT